MTFEILTAAKMSMLFFWVSTLCTFVGRYQGFYGIYCFHLQVTIWRPKINILSAMSQKAAIFILAAART
jgi:hypothetical protein